jgi:cell wall-associated NlpC family hydrolase
MLAGPAQMIARDSDVETTRPDLVAVTAPQRPVPPTPPHPTDVLIMGKPPTKHRARTRLTLRRGLVTLGATLTVATGTYAVIHTTDSAAQTSASYSHASADRTVQTAAQLTQLRHQITATRTALAQLPHLITALTATGTSPTQINHLQQRLQRHLTTLLATQRRLTQQHTTPTTPGPSTSPSTGSTIATVIAYARAQIGKPYQWGATGPDSYDCSGLIQRAYQAAGITLPRTTQDQQTAGPHITRDQLQPGDLIFTENYDHVQLYIGNGKVIQARHTGTLVAITDMPTDGIDAYVHIPIPANPSSHPSPNPSSSSSSDSDSDSDSD